ncbi:MAG: hypothetical protein U9O98_04695, partial [Asgard group archaeon]|nr:hypothetical protein [Asgard group archaeon]
STINLRDRLKPDLEGAFGFLSTALIFKQKYRKKASFWKNVKRYQKKLKRNLRNRKVFFLQKIFSKKASYEFLQKMGTYFVEVATKKEPFSVNNLGLLDDYLQDVDLDAFLPIDSFHGGMTSFLNILIVMVYTLQNEMHFHCHFIKTKYTMEEIKSLAKTVNKRIENAL